MPKSMAMKQLPPTIISSCTTSPRKSLFTLPSINTRPRPGRRRHIMGFASLSSIIHALFFLSVFCPTTLGSKHPQLELRRLVLSFQEDAILVERSPGPTPVLEARQFDFESTTTKKSSETQQAETTSNAAAATTTTAQGAAMTSTSGDDSTGSSTGIDSAPSPSDSPLPKAFDGGLGTNYTEPSCPKFLMDMVNNDTFSSCLPVSVLLQVLEMLLTAQVAMADPILTEFHVFLLCLTKRINPRFRALRFVQRCLSSLL